MKSNGNRKRILSTAATFVRKKKNLYVEIRVRREKTDADFTREEKKSHTRSFYGAFKISRGNDHVRGVLFYA